MSVRRKILKNLEGRVSAVNEMCALSGLGIDEAREEMYKLLREGLVEVSYFIGMPLYKLTFRGRDIASRKLKVIVDNDK